MDKHFRILGYLFAAWAAVNILLMLTVAIAPETLGARVMTGQRTILAIVAGLIIAVFYGAAGLSLLARKDWARTLTIAASVVTLFSFPFGTALGIYGLWAMLSSKGREEYASYSRTPSTGSMA